MWFVIIKTKIGECTLGPTSDTENNYVTVIQETIMSYTWGIREIGLHEYSSNANPINNNTRICQ